MTVFASRSHPTSLRRTFQTAFVHVRSRQLHVLSADSSPVATGGVVGPVTTAYESQVQSGKIRRDENQVYLASRLDALHSSLASTDPFVLPSHHLCIDPDPSRQWSSSSSSSSSAGTFTATSRTSWLERAATHAAHTLRRGLARAVQPAPPRGLYIHGTVGTGKSFLMDLFYQACGGDDCNDNNNGHDMPPSATRRRKRRRAHFHEFMLDVHHRIHTYKLRHPRADPIPPLAQSLAREARLLCFDEFQVTDIADAMIMRRLFTHLFDVGVVVVATSNRHPDELYEGGLNRSLFVPFIGTMKRTCDVVTMNAELDYRQLKRGAAAATTTPSGAGVSGEEGAGGSGKSYFWPPGDASSATQSSLERIFASGGVGGDRGGGARGGGDGRTETVPVMMGREVQVSKANDRVGWFDFRDLCHMPLGAADYIAICGRFPVLIVDGVPPLGADHYNEARRFVTLIDASYESRTRLVIAAEVPLDRLFVAFDAAVETNDGDEEVAVADLHTGRRRRRMTSRQHRSVVREGALQNIRGDEEVWVNGQGGSSSSFSTTMIRTGDGDVEWSATGRVGVSLAQLSAVKDVAFSFRRAASRLAEMSGESWGRA